MPQREKKNLQLRYLMWLYKTTKEQIDRIDRKFTQLDIDCKIRAYLAVHIKKYPPAVRNGLEAQLTKWSRYISDKEVAALDSKFCDSKKRIPRAEYAFLSLKLQVVEKLMRTAGGAKFLQGVKRAYYREMARRIFAEKESGRV